MQRSRDPELVRRIGAATALEVRATGIPYAFAPCIAVSTNMLKFNLFMRLVTYQELFGQNEFLSKLFEQVCRDPRWGRCYESYSEDPKVVQEMTDIILGLQGEIPNGTRKGVPYVAGKQVVLHSIPLQVIVRSDDNFFVSPPISIKQE